MSESSSIGFIVDEESDGQRIDIVIADTLTDKTRSQWKKSIQDELVFVNDKLAIAKTKVRAGDAVTVIEIPSVKQEFDLPILYEDDDVIVVDKPVGLLVHAKDSRNSETTVVDILKDKLPKEGGNRPGVVHRLDRDTSGVMILAKTEVAKSYIQKQFQNRAVNKTYVAIVQGVIKESEGLIKWPIERNPKSPSVFRVGKNGKDSETKFKVLEQRDDSTIVELHPKTGRTHQLRVHMAHLGNPIIGDRFYNGPTSERLMLHASKLEISIKHNDRKIFTSKVPFWSSK